MTERTTTEWAIWFDTDDPNDSGADVREESSYPMALHRSEIADPKDPPRGICVRSVTLIEEPWVIVND